MPLYEFRCSTCSKQFEELVSSSRLDSVTCPECNSSSVSRLMSTFSARVKSSSGSYRPTASSSGCSGCSSGTCSSCGKQ